jgi:uncharacterized protein with GYD domain
VPKYLLLVTQAEKGKASMALGPQRVERAHRAAEMLGIEILVDWMLQGEYDLGAYVEAPSDEALSTWLVVLGEIGNRFNVHRAFEPDEYKAILASVPEIEPAPR